MTADAEESTEWWQEDPRALLGLACGTRPDWSREETWRAIHASHNANVPWPQIVRKLLAIAFRGPDSSPLELRDETARVRPASPTGSAVYERGAALARELLKNRGERDGGAA